MCERQIVNPHQSYCSQYRVGTETTQARFGLSWDTAARLADQHTLSVQYWLSSRAPQAKCFEGRGVTATSTGLHVGLLNLALSSHFAPGSDDLVITKEIEAVKAFFADREVPYTWWLSPLATPLDMDVRLQSHGLAPRDYHLPAMIAPLQPPVVWPEFNPNIQVRQAQTLDDLQVASTIRRIAFRFPAGAALTYFEDMAEDWLCGDPARLYVARVSDADPFAAIGALIVSEGLPGVYVMATLPEWEHQGLGKALLAHILSTAAAEKYP
jgi:hypothetical protein